MLNPARFLKTISQSLVLLMLLGVSAHGQDLASTSNVLAASTIKPSERESKPLLLIQGRTFVGKSVTVTDLIKYAYGVHPSQVISGQEWVSTSRFDVQAVPEAAAKPNSELMKLLVKEVLTSRFRLQLRSGRRELPVYALQLSGDSLKMKPHTSEDDRSIPGGAYDPRGELAVGNATLTNVAQFLQRYITDRPVINHVDIAGRFDFDLKWAPDDGTVAQISDLPSFNTALREQLGLTLKPEHSETDILEVVTIDRPKEN